MAGSIRVYDYVADDATTYGIRLDRTNADAAGNTATASGTVRNGLPNDLQPRTAIYKWTSSGSAGQGSGTSVRRVVYGDKAAFDALAIGDTLNLPEYQAVAGVGQTTPNVMRAFVLTDKISERHKRAHFGGETGETQG